MVRPKKLTLERGIETHDWTHEIEAELADAELILELNACFHEGYPNNQYRPVIAFDPSNLLKELLVENSHISEISGYHYASGEELLETLQRERGNFIAVRKYKRDGEGNNTEFYTLKIYDRGAEVRKDDKRETRNCGV
ncbi:hypothetical protein ACFLYT_01705 [Nanoarchaeota archaeon]